MPDAPGRLQRVDHGPTGGHRVDAAGVGDEPGAPVDDERQRRAHVGREVTGEAEALVALAVLLQDGERQLGQRLADEVVDAGVEHVGDRIDPVAVEALPASEAHGHGAVVVDPPAAASISLLAGPAPARAPPGAGSGRGTAAPARWRAGGVGEHAEAHDGLEAEGSA